eukprot:TRINITY_DN48825_c0_g1_i1.p1 TRINITY_DN48825_c0_g1~~TRINITY_DN48825_c0_g1_i1.p1  ORF type:complete len:201 (-),score=37.29 TRINITY_DN48825_c0_g1_i1:137-739(-)
MKLQAYVGLLQLVVGACTLVNVTLIEWQGCPDCTQYGDGLVRDGLTQGLGEIMNLSVYFKIGSHPGIDSDPALHPWVACANSVTGDLDKQYFWYRVVACANPGKTVEDCIHEVNMPSALVTPIRQCMQDSEKAGALVDAMHKYGGQFQDYPWPLIEGKAVVPEPDMHHDDIAPLIKAVCASASAAGVSTMPRACVADVVV